MEKIKYLIDNKEEISSDLMTTVEKSISFLGFSKNEAVRRKSSSGGIGRERNI